MRCSGWCAARASTRSRYAPSPPRPGPRRARCGTTSAPRTSCSRRRLAVVVDRVRRRLEPLFPTLTGREGALTVLEQMLPLDATRRGETEVYLAFVTRVHPDRTLRRIRDHAEAESRVAVDYAIGVLDEAGVSAPDATRSSRPNGCTPSSTAWRCTAHSGPAGTPRPPCSPCCTRTWTSSPVPHAVDRGAGPRGRRRRRAPAPRRSPRPR